MTSKAIQSFITTWATSMMAVAKRTIAMEKEAYISYGSAKTTKLDFMTEAELVNYACEKLSSKYQVPMV